MAFLLEIYLLYSELGILVPQDKNKTISNQKTIKRIHSKVFQTIFMIETWIQSILQFLALGFLGLCSS